MERLYLKDNQLSGEIPIEFGNLITLERLYLDENQLSGEIPSEIGNLINLSHLYLSDNQLSGQIPEEICNQGDSSPNLENNNLCPPYPVCIEEYVGEQDISECECIPGDVNGDSILDILDVVLMVADILDEWDYDECDDLNSDTNLDILDVITLVNYIISSP